MNKIKLIKLKKNKNSFYKIICLNKKNNKIKKKSIIGFINKKKKIININTKNLKINIKNGYKNSKGFLKILKLIKNNKCKYDIQIK
ncbi:MAG: hypothetical protein AAYR31_00205 [Candidatus Vidania fulgoroideorum]